MAVPAAIPGVEDGDMAFTKVDTFLPAHELPVGTAADAVNKRFESGRACTRFGVNSQAWGVLPVTKNAGAPCGYGRFNDPQGFDTNVLLTDDWRVLVGEDGGRGRAFKIQSGTGPVEVTLNGHDVWGASRLIPCHGGLTLLRQGDERHYFSASRVLAITNSSAAADTLTVDASALTTGESCSVTGITGAAGGYFLRKVSATAVALYDTNAHAVAGGATGLFNVTVNGETGQLSRSNIDPTNSRIQLNSLPAWINADKVNYVAMPNSAITGATPPNPGAGYYVKNITGNQVELYSDAALTVKMGMTSAIGRFYLERAAVAPGFYGNGAPPLLAEPNELGGTLWDVGFKTVPTVVAITNTNNGNNQATAPNHRLLPGDAVLVTGLHTTGSALLPPCYAYPMSDHALVFYGDLLNALGNTGNNVVPLINNGETGTVKKNGASGMSMPPGREGCYFQNRLVIVNGRDTLVVSDALDPLHFTPVRDAITANLGESGNIQSVTPFAGDSLLIEKEDSGGIFLLGNFSGGPDAWTLTAITREYGQLAAQSGAQVGVDFWALSRKGVQSITQTLQGIVQGVADPVSKPMKKYVDQIDWRYASGAVGAYWNNRYFIAVPLKGQTAPVKNNGVLVYNFLNQGWEGLWQGAALEVFGFARLMIYGEDRLCFCDYSGRIKWLGDGFSDGAVAISDSLLTRRYTAGDLRRKLWLTADLNLDAYTPALTVTAIGPGYNEQTVLVNDKTYSKNKYKIFGKPDYDQLVQVHNVVGTPVIGGDYESPSVVGGQNATGTHTIKVYACVAGIYSLAGEASCTGQPFSPSTVFYKIHWTWDAVPNASYYRLIVSAQDTHGLKAGAVDILDGSVTSYDDDLGSPLSSDPADATVTPDGLTQPTEKDFDQPYREDYGLGADELMIGKVDVHQNHLLPLRLRSMAWGIQLLIENADGSCRLQSVSMRGPQRKFVGVEV